MARKRRKGGGVLKGITHARLARAARRIRKLKSTSVESDVRIPFRIEPGGQFRHHSSSGEIIRTNMKKIIDNELYFDPPKPIRPSRNQAFNDVIQELIDMHDKKNHDYANERNPFANFDIATRYLKVRGIEMSPHAQVESMKATKVARIINFLEMVEKGESPNFESEDDSELDFVIYWIIARAIQKRDGS